jgi:HEAT repeat protein
MAKAIAEIRSLARGHTEAAINVLASIMNQEKAPQAARVAAANSLLDRGWGKAPTVMEDGDGNPIQLVVTWQPKES